MVKARELIGRVFLGCEKRKIKLQTNSRSPRERETGRRLKQLIAKAASERDRNRLLSLRHRNSLTWDIPH